MIFVCVTNIEVADFPATTMITQMIGMSASASVIVFGWVFVERFWMIGSSVFDWKPVTARALRT